MPRQNTDFEILRDYDNAIKDKPWRGRARCPTTHWTREEQEDIRDTTQPYLDRLTQNMGHELADALSLLRAVLRKGA